MQDLLQKYLNGECSVQEKQELLKLLEEQPALLDGLLDDELPDAAEDELPGAETSARMKAAILSATVPVVPMTRSRTISRKWWAAAAAVIVAAGVGGYLANKPATSIIVAAKETIVKPAVPGTDDTTIINQGNKVQFIALREGSWIKLSPGSEVRFKINFVEDRRISLKGKAIFDVAKDTRHPFSVIANDITTTALGTRFGVESTRERVNIQLLQGKIQVAGSHMQQAFEPVILLPGDVFTAREKMPDIQIARAIPVNNAAKTSVGNTTVITQTTFNFYNEKLRKVISMLQEYYHEDITILPTVPDKTTFTGEFNKTESFEDIIRILADLNYLNVEKNDSTIILSTRKN